MASAPTSSATTTRNTTAPRPGPPGLLGSRKRSTTPSMGTPLVSPHVSSSRGRTPSASAPAGGCAASAIAVTVRAARATRR
ncbi:hypothetical protein [Blastococcus brunescens]|uniref:hypothetical protein n=1 Tax=Blastococcus brunescens TaxID=1564165 RepID=UPI003BEF47A9